MIPEVLVNVIFKKMNVKGISMGKEEIKLYLFTDNIIIYVEYPKEFTKKKNPPATKKV